jgi:fructose-bisphosphate aldolase, class I
VKNGLLGQDGRTVIVALDHALASGQVAPLDAPKAMLDKLLPAQPDGLILSYGMLKLLPPDPPMQRWLTADYYATSTLPGGNADLELQDRLWSADTAKWAGASGLKVLLVFGRNHPEVHLRNVRNIADLVVEAAAVGLPVMVEPVLWGSAISEQDKNDPSLIAHAARVAFELGADLVKVPIPHQPKTLETLTQKLPIPVLLMGGPATDPAHLFRLIREAMDAGAAGVALGRNVWQYPSPGAMVKALRHLVHDGFKPTDALEVLHLGGQA